MATVYNLTADLCPAPVTPSGVLSVAAGVPTTAAPIVPNDSGSGSLSTPFNANAVRLDALGRAGAGAYAIDWDSGPDAATPGLELTVDSGLTIALGTGQAVLDGVVQTVAETTLALTDNISRIYLWLTQNGTLTPVSNSLTPPAGACVFLGSCETDTGAIVDIDGSGVCYHKGGAIWRRTADTSCPADSPPAGIAFLTEGPGGVWLWTGEAYWLLTGSGRAALEFASDANKTLTAPEWENAFLDFPSGVGTTLTATRDVVLPHIPGRAWDVRNNSDGGQSLQFIGATGTGITVATGKVARIASDGTNFLRLSADL